MPSGLVLFQLYVFVWKICSLPIFSKNIIKFYNFDIYNIFKCSYLKDRKIIQIISIDAECKIIQSFNHGITTESFYLFFDIWLVSFLYGFQILYINLYQMVWRIRRQEIEKSFWARGKSVNLMYLFYFLLIMRIDKTKWVHVQCI